MGFNLYKERHPLSFDPQFDKGKKKHPLNMYQMKKEILKSL